MSHRWEKTGERSKPPFEAGRVVWRCARCGEEVREEDGKSPDPDMVFWRGVGSEVDECDDMVVLSVMSG